MIWFGGTAFSPGATADVVEEHGQLVRRSMDNVRQMHPERHVEHGLYDVFASAVGVHDPMYIAEPWQYV